MALTPDLPPPSYGGDAPPRGAEGESCTDDLGRFQIWNRQTACLLLSPSGPAGHLSGKTGEEKRGPWSSTPGHGVELLHVFLRRRHEAGQVLVEHLDVVGVAMINQRAFLKRDVDDLVVHRLALGLVELAARA